MENMLEARITGGLLRWARERRDYTFAEVASSTNAGIDQLMDWENGIALPPFGLAENLAHFLRIPFGFLFLTAPPVDSSPIADFRTLSDETPTTLSPDFLEVLNDVRLKQDWYAEYAEQNLANLLPVVGTLEMSAGVARVAADIGEKLGVNQDLRRQSDGWAAYLTALCNRAQGLGILVMRSGVVGSDSTRALNVKEFRGFALSDPLAPVVFINSKDSHSAQVFTLLHEIAHIWTGQTGISNPDPSGVLQEGIERFCNQVAAEVLVPQQEFEHEWNLLTNKAQFAEEMSRLFWVSPLVMTRRAFDEHKISEEEFFRLVRIEKSKPFSAKRGQGGNPLRTLVARNGRKFTEAILEAVREDRLTYRDGARLLGTSNKFFPELLRKPIG